MLRSIYRKVLGAFTTNHRGRATHRARPRRLAIESLESRKLLTAAVLTSNSISDGGFEAPSLPAYAYQVAPVSLPWQFTGIGGISANDSGFTNGNSNAPQGSQVAFIKDNANMTQTVYLVGGVYDVSFLAAQRVKFQTQSQEIEVLIDGANVGQIIPASTAYATYQSWSFPVTTGTHQVEFLGMTPAGDDSTAFLDNVVITPVDDTIADSGFEAPTLAANTSATDPGGLPWQFTGTAGVSSNGSSMVANATIAQTAPEGTQVGYVQETGSISQSVYLDAGTYQVSFQAAQAAVGQATYQEIEVSIDSGVNAGEITPTSTTYAAYQSSSFTVAAGPHTITFVGLDPIGGDNTALIDEVSISPINAIADSSFETLNVAAGTYELTPAGLPWQFSGGAGVSSNGSSFTVDNPAAPNGTQVAFLNGTGSISQSVTLAAGSYNISFQAAQCANTPSVAQTQQIEVEVDSTPVGYITPTGTSYGLYETQNFMVTAGTHTIQFIGTNPQGGNNTALIDVVSLTPSADTITDGGFETPDLGEYAYQTTSNGSPWQFTGTAGISGNDSGFTDGNVNAPQGTQVGFIKDTGSMSYSVYLDADTYSLSLVAAQRALHQSQNQEIEVFVDSTLIDTITASGTSYTAYQTPNFTVAAGVHSIQFVGLSPVNVDSTAFIDEVSLATMDDAFSNASFETPVLTAKTYSLTPANAGWQFTGAAGISANGSAFTGGNPNAPAGSQVALIKDNGSMSQTVYFEAGAYSVSFLAAQRAKYQTQQVEVTVDGTPVGLFTPANTSYNSYQTTSFLVTTGAHTIAFVGMTSASSDSTAFLDNAAISAGSAIGDGSFEQVLLAAHAYQVAPAGTPWQFTGTAGISANDSAFTCSNPNAPAGDQVAFIKQTGTMSETIEMAAGVYNLSFMAAQRAKYANESIEILVDGAEVGTVTPGSISYGQYVTSSFIVTAGAHTIEFVGVDPSGGDCTAFIDNVQL